ncbi:glycosyltransferase family 2 protein [Chitinimonas arctica]|uniref:Glycosyltransferase family 2 protein n=1 Tax=Chitinimonas arctica TaxID=2594795 RepID=A0A516SI15_9NEIS|nr:glycosyltransferase family 2 protein [Chitinimonas arctica]QDQ27797.1 glycosyltransferase family 2 protein [Chitinimonas arctica]
MSCCVVIPVYNHGAAIGAVVAAVRAHALPCLLVDDGSHADCAAVLDALAAADPAGVSLLRLAQNQGKGGAMLAGLRAAHAAGYSHALQIDADGQHNCADIPLFLQCSDHFPAAIVCGCPLFDDSVPRSRFYGRYLTHACVWLQTLSFAIRDSMCGFRLYPLAATVALLDSVRIGRRMDFDTDIIVRLFWRDVPVINLLTRVTYPSDGVSHFRMWRDNLLMIRLHIRLLAGMLPRAPRLIWRSIRRQALRPAGR